MMRGRQSALKPRKRTLIFEVPNWHFKAARYFPLFSAGSGGADAVRVRPRRHAGRWCSAAAAPPPALRPSRRRSPALRVPHRHGARGRQTADADSLRCARRADARWRPAFHADAGPGATRWCAPHVTPGATGPTALLPARHARLRCCAGAGWWAGVEYAPCLLRYGRWSHARLNAVGRLRFGRAGRAVASAPAFSNPPSGVSVAPIPRQ
jgi:hypothetical protein